MPINIRKVSLITLATLVLVLSVYALWLKGIFIESLLFVSSALLSVQGIITISWMLFAWNDPDKKIFYQAPDEFKEPKYSFTAIIPVRHEEKVIEDTIKAVDAIDYPTYLKEIIIVLRHDDFKTYLKVQKLITDMSKENIKLTMLLDSYPINKPTQLNYALPEVTSNIIAIFDAEDEPHKDLYKVVNTVFVNNKVDVVQSGVQLMNYDSHWFSTLNVLEYFFWFKSGLAFFTEVGGVSPLGGNTVFFKKQWFKIIGGWDSLALTEDTDIGIRLTLTGAKTKIIYDELYATKEETPHSTISFIQQRTRWTEGFLQILFKGYWLKLAKYRQKLFTFYILLAPIIPIMLFLYMPVGVFIGLNFNLPMYLVLFSYLPMYLLIILILINAVGFYEFTKAYNLKVSKFSYIKLVLTYLPYIFLLSFSSLRAIIRFAGGNFGWEKTLHLNTHRDKAYASEKL